MGACFSGDKRDLPYQCRHDKTATTSTTTTDRRHAVLSAESTREVADANASLDDHVFDEETCASAISSGSSLAMHSNTSPSRGPTSSDMLRHMILRTKLGRGPPTGGALGKSSSSRGATTRWRLQRCSTSQQAPSSAPSNIVAAAASECGSGEQQGKFSGGGASGSRAGSLELQGQFSGLRRHSSARRSSSRFSLDVTAQVVAAGRRASVQPLPTIDYDKALNVSQLPQETYYAAIERRLQEMEEQHMSGMHQQRRQQQQQQQQQQERQLSSRRLSRASTSSSVTATGATGTLRTLSFSQMEMQLQEVQGSLQGSSPFDRRSLRSLRTVSVSNTSKGGRRTRF